MKTTLLAGALAMTVGLAGAHAHADGNTQPIACDASNAGQHFDFYGEYNVGGKGLPKLTGKYRAVLVEENISCYQVQYYQNFIAAYNFPVNYGIFANSLKPWGYGCDEGGLAAGAEVSLHVAIEQLVYARCTKGYISKEYGDYAQFPYPYPN